LCCSKTMEITTWLISIKSIFENNRNIFKIQNENQIRKSTIDNVEKILKCWSMEAWFTSYRCNECWEVKHIPFTCKSRFCNSCSQPQSDIRMGKLVSRRPSWLLYKHIVFTIPEELRSFFKRHRSSLNILPYTASNAIMYFLKDQKVTPWILAVIHTFWAKLNRNPHTHLIVTEWAMHRKWYFKRNIFLTYKGIRESRTKFLVKNLKDRTYKNVPWDKCFQEIRFLNDFYDYHSKISKEKTTRHVHFPPKPCSFIEIVGYVGRYVKRPVIAQSRILKYENDNVTFNYTDKRDKIVKDITCTAIEFMEFLLQHLPNRNFRMIYYYWIFSNRCKNKYLKIINIYYNNEQKMPRIARNFRERMFMFTGKDFLKCGCWWCFHKYQTIISWYKPKYFDSS
jgi:hypothetical protein